MAILVSHKSYSAVRCVLLIVVTWMVTSSAVFAQGGLGNAIFALRRTVAGDQNDIAGRLYGAAIVASITNRDGNTDNFTDADTMRRFILSPVRGGDAPLSFAGGNRTQFNDWVRANASQILALMFPTSLSASVLGRDLAQTQSQDFLLSNALGMAPAPSGGRPRNAGGLLEHEWFQRDGRLAGDSGSAWRGLYQLERIHMSLTGSYTRQHEDVLTSSTTVGVDYHPFVEINPALEWRVGGDARYGLLYSRSDAFNLGSMNVGGGVWTSAKKDFSKVRLGFGSLFQGTKEHVPGSLVGDDYRFLSDAVNARGISYDLAYGTLVGYATSPRTSLNAKVLETRTVKSDADRPASRLVLASFSYLVGGETPVDIGYKISTGGGLKAQSLFLQGNFRW